MPSSFYTYKIIESHTNFYYLIVSHINNKDIVLTHFENQIEQQPDEPISQFFDFCWDDVKIEPSDVKSSDVINGNIPNDRLCINVSDDYKNALNKLLEEEKIELANINEKKARAKPKPKAEKPIKEAKAPKPKGKKAVVVENVI